MSQRRCSRAKTSWTTSSPVAWSPTMNAASFTSPGRCTRYASAKPDPADDVGRSAVSSAAYRSALGLIPTTLHAPAIGCLRPLSTILRSPGWGANTSDEPHGELRALPAQPSLTQASLKERKAQYPGIGGFPAPGDANRGDVA